MSDWSGSYFGWEPRKSAAARRADAARQIKAAARGGKPMTPVVIVGRKIATTFWGKAWCDNLERYRDFAYHLERGRGGNRVGWYIESAKRIAAEDVSRTCVRAASYADTSRPLLAATERA